MYINRDWSLSEDEDIEYRIKRRLDKYTEAVPIYHEGYVIGWKIQGCRE